jgi:site-specific DNA-methyltransferase (adenine-specific)
MAKYNCVLEGDCTEVLKALPSESVDLVVTDPPYFVRYRDRAGRTIANDVDPASVLDAFTDIYRLLKPNTFCISFYGWNHVDAFFAAWRRAGFHPVGHFVWHKDYASSTGFLRARHEQAYLLAKGRPAKPAEPLDDVRPWKYTGNVRHPTEKDVSILQPLIERFSKPGDLVLDPFAGSGSTLVAAAKAGRRYVGIELEPHYCDAVLERLAALGDQAADGSRTVDMESDDELAIQALWEWLARVKHYEAAQMTWQVMGSLRA